MTCAHVPEHYDARADSYRCDCGRVAMTPEQAVEWIEKYGLRLPWWRRWWLVLVKGI